MSENLKRAESLFNRIMNQNGMNGKNENSGFSGKNGANSNYNSHNNVNHSNHSQQNSHHSHSHHKSYKYNKASNYNGNHNSQYNQPSNVDLPKRDPLKLSQETLESIPEDHHILPYCWTVWHHSRARPKLKDAVSASPEPVNEDNNTGDENGQATAGAVDSYLQTTNEIEFSAVNGKTSTKNIGSLEQLWLSMSSLKKTYELAIGTELLVFKSGINPVWEDPINTKGGRWVFRFNRRSNNSNNHSASLADNDSVLKVRQRTSLIWERLLLKTITGSIIPDGNYSEEIQDLLLNDICGLVLSVRKDEDIISIWNCNLNFNKKRAIPDEKDDDKKNQNKKLTSFQARRIICDSILRVIRECDLIFQGSDCITTLDSGSNERVFGVSFEYRLHSDNNNPSMINPGADGKYNRRYTKPYHGHHNHNHSKNDSDN